MINQKRYMFEKISIFLFVFVLLFTANGCDALRKKFTRKKKDTVRNKGPLPILEPIDYARKEYTSVDLYGRAYSLWQVWSKELESTVERSVNDKNQRYLIRQIITQVLAMKDLLSEKKAEELEIVLKQYLLIQEEYSKSKSMRQTSQISNNLRIANKSIRLSFNLEMIQDNLK